MEIVYRRPADDVKMASIEDAQGAPNCAEDNQKAQRFKGSPKRRVHVDHQVSRADSKMGCEMSGTTHTRGHDGEERGGGGERQNLLSKSAKQIRSASRKKVEEAMRSFAFDVMVHIRFLENQVLVIQIFQSFHLPNIYVFAFSLPDWHSQTMSNVKFLRF